MLSMKHVQSVCISSIQSYYNYLKQFNLSSPQSSYVHKVPHPQQILVENEFKSRHLLTEFVTSSTSRTLILQSYNTIQWNINWKVLPWHSYIFSVSKDMQLATRIHHHGECVVSLLNFSNRWNGLLVSIIPYVVTKQYPEIWTINLIGKPLR